MAYDEDVAARLRTVLSDEQDVREQKMFGGIAFMVDGKMAVGVIGDDLLLRLGERNAEAALDEEPHARPMDFTGKPMRNMIFLAPAGFAGDDALRAWVGRAVAFAKTIG